MKSLLLSYLLWLVGGLFGLHKFYLGRPIMGLLYFFTGGLFFVGWRVDLFTLPRQVRRENLEREYEYSHLTEVYEDEEVVKFIKKKFDECMDKYSDLDSIELELMRLKDLIGKYEDMEIVEDVMNGKFWQGMSSEMVNDALGDPDDVEQKVLKNNTREVWKYDEIGKNRYALKLFLENNEVVGWDQK